MEDAKLKNLKKLEIIGVIFTFLMAVLLHFCYDLSDGAVWSILFAAANESIWEHIKILTLPYMFWSVIELALIRIPIKNIIVAKTSGIYAIVVSTILFFTVYTGIIGRSIAVIDIVSAFLWISLGFFISYKIMTSDINASAWFTVAAFALLLFIAMFLTFTINPPKLGIFLDSTTGTYGIPKKFLDAGAMYLNKLAN